MRSLISKAPSASGTAMPALERMLTVIRLPSRSVTLPLMLNLVWADVCAVNNKPSTKRAQVNTIGILPK
ncbi:hypothetical protein [Pedobacter cryotolerans]|uniref:hypothetical protein n=1 Tax=Pedobacter cryotolerans TaxID=2571270 RepID=UPI001CEDF4A9|nr:hypothetical protein [Pedobacter cryotolerans]